MRRCYHCGTEWVSDKREPGVKEFCAQCEAYLHCCRNCHFYDSSVAAGCAIPTTEFVADKMAANFCDEFVFRVEDPDHAQSSEADAARESLDNLFGEGGSGQHGHEEGRDAFRRLFGD